MRIYLFFISAITLLLSSCTLTQQGNKELTYRKSLGYNGQEIKFCLEAGAKKMLNQTR